MEVGSSFDRAPEPQFKPRSTKEIYTKLKQGEAVKIDLIDAIYLSESDEPQPSTGKLIYESSSSSKPAEISIFESPQEAAA